MAFKLKYDQDRFDDAMIERVLNQMTRLMVYMSKSPELPLNDVALMDEDERKQVLIDWNRTEKEYPRELCLHHAFEQQAAKTPDNIALEYKEQSLSYAGLNERANQLAHLLLAQGVKPDTTVAICVERSMEMIIGILGVLKAGAAYVPIDPAHPEERIAYMLDDSQAVVVLTQAGLADKFTQAAAPVICLGEKLFADRAHVDVDNIQTDVASTNLAYVIYTSGTTGLPKGVAVEHRSAMNMVQAYIAYFGLDESSRVLQFTSFSFDVSVSEIWQALLSGGTLVIEDRESLLPGPDLVRTLRERRISKVSMASSLLASLPVAEYPDLAVLEVGGDACSRELVSRYATGRKFFNCYGPTEATVGTVIKQLTLDDDTPTIGRPFPEHQAVRAGSKPQARSCRRTGRAVHRRRVPGARILEPPRAYSGAFCRQSIRTTGRTALPDWRPRALPAGWQRRLPRPFRRSGKNSRLSYRAGRNRRGAQTARSDP